MPWFERSRHMWRTYAQHDWRVSGEARRSLPWELPESPLSLTRPFHSAAYPLRNMSKTTDVSRMKKTSRQTLDIHPMLDKCWSSVADAGSTLIQHWLSVSRHHKRWFSNVGRASHASAQTGTHAGHYTWMGASQMKAHTMKMVHFNRRGHIMTPKIDEKNSSVLDY